MMTGNDEHNPLEDFVSTTVFTDGNLIFLPLGNDCVFMISLADLQDAHRLALARGNIDRHAATFAGESPFDSGTHVIAFKETLLCDDGHPRRLEVRTLEEFDEDVVREALEAWCEWAEAAFSLLEKGADVADAFRLAATGLDLGMPDSASGI